MAARKVRGVGLSHFEIIAGGILLVLYLLVLPFIRAGLFRAVEHLFGTSISPQTENVIYYYVLFAVTLVIFYGFIGRSTGYFFGNFVETLYAVGVGLVLFYGLNEVLFRLSRALFGHQLNLNDYPISAQIHDAPKATVLIFGRILCGGTVNTLADVAKSDWVKSPDIRVIFAECEGASKEEVRDFAGQYASAGIISCYGA